MGNLYYQIIQRLGDYNRIKQQGYCGIIDGGVDARHPDLAGQVNPNKSVSINTVCTCGSFIYGSHSLYDVGGMLVCSGCGYMEYY